MDWLQWHHQLHCRHDVHEVTSTVGHITDMILTLMTITSALGSHYRHDASSLGAHYNMMLMTVTSSLGSHCRHVDDSDISNGSHCRHDLILMMVTSEFITLKTQYSISYLISTSAHYRHDLMLMTVTSAFWSHCRHDIDDCDIITGITLKTSADFNDISTWVTLQTWSDFVWWQWH